MKGIITKNNVYTVTIKNDENKTVFKQNGINTLEAARLILKGNKQSLLAVPSVSPTSTYKRSYPELEGKIITWKGNSCSYTGRVVGCDYWIGVTIVDAYDKKHYLTCVRGPLSPQGKETLKRKPKFFDNYDDKFLYYVASITEGFYVSQDNPHINQGGGTLNSSNCAFGA